ncbi:hypothetical protein Ddye_002099 [Dipteronia dyeriana]|uniref:Tetraspanin n=1 Tax=Dipteronia dyeriana TaxID=168575 RepID=A0AAD9XQ61_9ROSI|nr:hypothetical protein Ddye_002099 [Dipteronia dyeriana]
MARLSTCIFILLNCISLVSGFAAVIISAHIQFRGGTDCQRALQTPLLVTGLFLTFMSTLGLTGSCCKSNRVLWIYLSVLFFLIIGLIIFTIFAFIVTTDLSGGRAYPNRLQDYSNWLKNNFVTGKNWEDIKSCLIDAKVCNNLDNADITHWSLIQSGCCKPPKFCVLEKSNTTSGRAGGGGAAAGEHSDCLTWSDKPEKLCFECKSCKGGVLASIKRQWRVMALLNLAVIAVVLIIFIVGCCVRRNNRSDRYVRYSAYSNWPNN